VSVGARGQRWGEPLNQSRELLKRIQYGARAAWLLGLAVAAQPLQAASAEIKHEKDTKGEFISIMGDIEEGDLAKFRRLAVTYDEAVVFLASNGGLVGEAIEIGKIIRIKGYNTFVAYDEPCNSACALVWLAGRSRYLEEGGKVGFHATYVEANGRKRETGVGNAIVGSYLTQLNLSESAVAFATSAGPDHLNELTVENAASVGIPLEVIAAKKQRAKAASGTPAKDSGTHLYRRVGNWTVAVDDTLGGGCFVLAEFGDVALRVGADLSQTPMTGYAIIFGKGWASIEKRAEYPIEIRFGDARPYKLKASGTEIGGVKGVGFTFDKSGILDQMSSAPDMRVSYRDNEVVHANLEGASEALDAMRDCQAAQPAPQSKAPRDPFAR
jgi:hypothetical protein